MWPRHHGQRRSVIEAALLLDVLQLGVRLLDVLLISPILLIKRATPCGGTLFGGGWGWGCGCVGCLVVGRGEVSDAFGGVKLRWDGGREVTHFECWLGFSSPLGGWSGVFSGWLWENCNDKCVVEAVGWKCEGGRKVLIVLIKTLCALNGGESAAALAAGLAACVPLRLV